MSEYNEDRDGKLCNYNLPNANTKQEKLPFLIFLLLQLISRHFFTKHPSYNKHIFFNYFFERVAVIIDENSMLNSASKSKIAKTLFIAFICRNNCHVVL